MSERHLATFIFLFCRSEVSPHMKGDREYKREESGNKLVDKPQQKKTTSSPKEPSQSS